MVRDFEIGTPTLAWKENFKDAVGKNCRLQQIKVSTWRGEIRNIESIFMYIKKYIHVVSRMQRSWWILNSAEELIIVAGGQEACT